MEPDDFEFDPEKSHANREKHGINFIEVQGIFEDPRIRIIPSPYPHEKRFLAIGTHRERVFAVVFTLRNGKVRLISARRARKKEKAAYHLG